MDPHVFNTSIVDASIFPGAPGGNTQAPARMIAERAMQRITGEPRA